MSDVVSIGLCPVCNRRRRLDAAGGCAECVERFGARIVPIAVRIRHDRRFRELCWRALSERARVAFVEYFGQVDAVVDAHSDGATRRELVGMRQPVPKE